MPDRSPAQEIQAAAAKLRQLLTFLGDNRGPWQVVTNERGYPQSIQNVGVPYVVADCFEGPEMPFAIAPYIATMHPGIVEPLAGWLEQVATVAEAVSSYDPSGVEWACQHPLALSRAINGGDAV